ncbi:MAG: lysophospholipid acyltransferase family protein, partial [Acidobacteriota bacterium]
LLFSVPGQARFLAKRSLFRIPFFGPGLRAAGFVPVDRHDRDRAAETFAVALDQLRTGRSLILFPEETRSSDGQLLPFKRGGVLLAVRTGHPVIPIGLRGTGRVRRKGSLWTRPGRVRVRYGRPIPTRGAGAAGRRELAAQVRAEVARLAFDD